MAAKKRSLSGPRRSGALPAANLAAARAVKDALGADFSEEVPRGAKRRAVQVCKPEPQHGVSAVLLISKWLFHVGFKYFLIFSNFFSPIGSG